MDQYAFCKKNSMKGNLEMRTMFGRNMALVLTKVNGYYYVNLYNNNPRNPGRCSLGWDEFIEMTTMRNVLEQLHSQFKIFQNIVHEEVLDNDGNNLTPTDDWRVGRRVVELGVITDHLQKCKHSGLPPSLHNTINIKTYGLGSVLKVLCTNKSCGNINAIPTGKQHDY
ncbi:unnamed protein product [Mytilus edulis]|uniref:Uncharacterized protein n=1 Tax=Mytilus edulis TaxID=6550 RepID=A0A8S3UUG1_MYTED|nr:unnamed protein product [Mytilus edulis]